MLFLCAKIVPNFKNLFVMYTILINNQIKEQTTDKAVAFANFRAICRDYDNKPHHITLKHDDDVIHEKGADLQLLNDIDDCTANDVLLAIINQLSMSSKDAKAIIKESQLNASNSRIDGWFCQPSNRKFVKLHHDELVHLIPYFLKNNTSSVNEIGFTANNLKTMRKQMGLSQDEVAQIVGVSGNRQVRRWENGEQDMPSEKWQVFLNYFKNNA